MQANWIFVFIAFYFRSKYKEPQLSEGFSEIVHVNFVPKFENAEAEKLYSMYLLDKY